MKLDDLFAPKTISVIGASNRSGSAGGAIIANLKASQYGGTIQPINPQHKEIGGLQCFSSISAAPAKTDLAIVAVPAASVIEEFRGLIANGVETAIIISSGFREGGDEAGNEREAILKKLALENNIAVLGPNCLGVCNFRKSMAISFLEGMGDIVNHRAAIAALESRSAIMVSELSDAIEIASFLGKARLKRGRGRKVAIVSGSGGAGVLACEGAARGSVELTTLDQETVDRLQQMCQSFVN